jgi:hypothetical protein
MAAAPAASGTDQDAEVTMSFTTLRRAARSALVLIALSTLWPGMPGVAQAAVPIADVGSHGTYKITDSPARPGARCRYEGTAGTWYLQRIRVAAPTIFGSSADLQSVGYRLLLQRRTAHGWTTAQRGMLISGVADRSTAATLTSSTVVRDVEVAPNWPRYRAAVQLTWWDAQAQVEGRVLLAIDHHRRTSDASVGPACPGHSPIG